MLLSLIVRPNPEQRADLRRLGAVPVLLVRRQRSDEQGVGPKLAVDEGRVDPGEQRGVRRVVGRARRVAADRAVQPAVHALVDRVDAARALADLRLGPEGEREHRPDGPAHAPDVGEHPVVEAAVGADARRHEGMRELQENRPPPAQHDDRLAVDPVGDEQRPGARAR